MNFLKREKEVFTQYFPNLQSELLKHNWEELESPKSTIIDIYKRNLGAHLIVPKKYGGKGASLLDAIRIHRFLGFLSPSLAVIASMHNFTIGMMLDAKMYSKKHSEIFKNVIDKNFLIASAFSEGKPGNILKAAMEFIAKDAGYILNGSKKPCSTAYSMDYISVGVSRNDEKGDQIERGIALVPKRLEGISTKEFWNAKILEATESHEVKFDNVYIEADYVWCVEMDADLDTAECAGFIWFALIVSASYIGMASYLVSQVLEQKKGIPTERVLLCSYIESAMKNLESVAIEAQAGLSEAAAANSILMRFAVQESLKKVIGICLELLGGIGFIKNPRIAYYYSCASLLPLHPPPRIGLSDFLDDYLQGSPLRVAHSTLEEKQEIDRKTLELSRP